MLVLGIETSCDESAAAVADDDRVISNVVASQVRLHSEHGGVVPEIAARAHVEAIGPVIDRATESLEAPVDLVAFTAGPGLVGSLVVGVSAAKALSWSWGIPMVAVNHVDSHAYAPACEGRLPGFPFVSLVASGGHTVLLMVEGWGDVRVMGQTMDDAAGEAFDKVAKYLGLGYPGGPAIDELSRDGDPSAVSFPRPMMSSDNLDFSYSGLKTAVIRYVERASAEGKLPSPEDLAASFQEAAVEVLVRKTVRAAREAGVLSVVLGGGVACNSRLRSAMERALAKANVECVCPSPWLCTDNGAIIAMLGRSLFLRGWSHDLSCDVHPGLPPGAGVPAGSTFTGGSWTEKVRRDPGAPPGPRT